MDGELSSEAQSRVLDLLSHSFNETSNQMTKFLEKANAITLNSKDSNFLIWSVFFFYTNIIYSSLLRKTVFETQIFLAL